MLRRLMLACLIVAGFVGINTVVMAAPEKAVTVGIVVPIELPAMKQIVQGFKDRLNEKYKGKVTYVVKNAQGNPNIQRAILQEFSSGKYDIVAPIGTAATQMAISMIRNTPILGIAAQDIKKEGKAANNLQVTGVLDEVSPVKQIAFIHKAMPELKQITLIHSTEPRIFEQVKQVVKAGRANGIKVQNMMINKLSELYSVSKQIDPKSQAIFILKDELIVAGLNTLIVQAEKKHMALIASDDGSVAKGAAFALGVSERQIGLDSGDLAAQILQGKKASDIPVTIMKKYTVFTNTKAAKAQGVDLKAILAAQNEGGYLGVNFNP